MMGRSSRCVRCQLRESLVVDTYLCVVGVIAGGTVLLFVWGYLLVQGIDGALRG